MYRPGWMDRVSNTSDDIGARYADLSDTVAGRWRDTNQMLRARGEAGLDAARDFGDEMVGSARRIGRNTRDFAVERPFETALIVGVAGFAIGWLLRRMRETPARSAPARTARSKSRSKTSSK